MRRLPAFLAALAITASVGAGCGKTDNNAPVVIPSDNATAGMGEAPKVPNLPATLPTFKDAGALDRDVKATILMAATYALNVPDDDRHPTVVAQDGFICGVKGDVDTCMPSSPTAAVTTILYSPETFWSNLQKPAAQGGGLTLMQDRTIAAYMNYILYRQAERYSENGKPLNLLAPANDTDANAAKLHTLQLRITGQVFCGLKRHSAVSDDLATLYSKYTQNNRTRGDFLAGVGGVC